ncbi:MAG: hypothetical protein WCI55_05485 [Armatimonadota bacterium]
MKRPFIFCGAIALFAIAGAQLGSRPSNLMIQDQEFRPKSGVRYKMPTLSELTTEFDELKKQADADHKRIAKLEAINASQADLLRKSEEALQRLSPTLKGLSALEDKFKRHTHSLNLSRIEPGQVSPGTKFRQDIVTIDSSSNYTWKETNPPKQ